MSNDVDITREELQRRVIYSLMLPVARLAHRFRVPLKELSGWMQIAYFHELRRGGLTLREACELLNVGMRKAAELSSSLKANFFQPEAEHELPRRVEYMLWAEPLSRARIHQVLRDEKRADLDQAIERLLAEHRIREVAGRSDVFERTSREARLVTPQWMTQIDGVNNFGASLTEAVHGRVFDDSAESLLRTLTFELADADVGELKKLYEEVIFPRLAELEERSKGQSSKSMSVSICWAPNSSEPEGV